MITLSKQVGNVSDRLVEARRIAQLTEHEIEFSFGGVTINVGVCYMGTPNIETDIQRILDAVNNSQEDTLYL